MTAPTWCPGCQHHDEPRPRLLDAFCCEGGAGMGYHRAGWCVTGVDIEDQPRYPFTFVKADAITYIREHGHTYVAGHGSPTCQWFARVTRWRGTRDAHQNLIPDTRAAFASAGIPYVIENVMEAVTEGELRPDLILCGSMFNLRVRRHRAFETSWSELQLTPRCTHQADDVPFEHKDERAFADAMGCTWMTAQHGGRQAIPPAYTEFIGAALLAHVTAGVAA